MYDSGSGSTRGAWRNEPNFQPHAFDPWTQPELFRGVLSRRVFAFLIDLVVLSIPVILAVIFIAVFGLITLGLGWVLFWLVSPASVIWALVYYGSTLGGPHSATLGMRVRQSPVMVTVSPGLTSAMGSVVSEFRPVNSLTMLCSIRPVAGSAGGLTA